MVKALAYYLCGCVCHAWRGSIGSALNWASVIGIGVVGAYREHVWGRPMTDPHTWQGIVVWTLIYTAVAWLIIFAVRLIFVAPFRLYYEEKTRADRLEGLRQIANDASRPPSFDIGIEIIRIDQESIDRFDEQNHVDPYGREPFLTFDDQQICRVAVENLVFRC